MHEFISVIFILLGPAGCMYSQRITSLTQACGFQDLDPGSTLTSLKPLQSDVSLYTSVWEGILKGVNGSATLRSPHNRYLDQREDGHVFTLITTSEYPRFLESERTDVMKRSVELSCTEGGSVVYFFSFKIADDKDTLKRHVERELGQSTTGRNIEGKSGSFNLLPLLYFLILLGGVCLIAFFAVLREKLADKGIVGRKPYGVPCSGQICCVGI